MAKKKTKPPGKKAGNAVREEVFVQEYLKDLNGAQAAIRAGYSEKTAGQIAYQLLHKPSIAKKIQLGMSERLARAKFTADDVLQDLAELARARLADMFEWDGDEWQLKSPKKVPKHVRRGLVAMKVKRAGRGEPVEIIEFKMVDPIATYRLLAQHLGLLIEKHEHSGKEGGPIEVIEVVKPQEKA
jgi:phage terminase small subunit